MTIDNSVLYNFNNKSIEQLKEDIEKLIIENQQLKKMLSSKESEITKVTIYLWSYRQDGRDASTTYLDTVDKKDVKSYCEWWQLYNEIEVDNNFLKFEYEYHNPMITWDIEKGKKMINEKMANNNYKKMENWLNERR